MRDTLTVTILASATALLLIAWCATIAMTQGEAMHPHNANLTALNDLPLLVSNDSLSAAETYNSIAFNLGHESFIIIDLPSHYLEYGRSYSE